jgi:hypothetical protein
MILKITQWKINKDAFHTLQRNVLSNNEWAGWLQWMKTAFEEGEILEYWKTTFNHRNGLILHS